MVIEFKATDEQIKQMGANAVNASSPMGLGFLSANAKQFSPDEMPLEAEANGLHSLHLDYVGGRMVKLSLMESKPGLWKAFERVSPDYQSWVSKYPTMADLVRSVGAEVVRSEGKVA